MLASGSTITSSPAGTGVTQARPSRPLTRIPQVPQEAWKQEWRNARRGVLLATNGDERVEDHRARADGDVEGVVALLRRVVALLAAGDADPDGALLGGRCSVMALLLRRVVGAVRKGHDLPGLAGRLDANLPADDVGGRLGHRPERRALAAGDRDEPLDAVRLAMVEALERPAQLAPGVGVASSRSAGGPPTRRLDAPRSGSRGSSSSPRRTSARRGPRGPRGRRDPPRPRSSCRRPRGRAGERRCRRRRTRGGG